MPSQLFFMLTVTFSIVTGTAAGLLSIQTWEILRRTPFGKAVFVLSLVMVAFIVYHVVLMVTPGTLPVAKLFKSATFTGVAVFIGTLIWSQHQMRTQPAVSGG